MTAGVGKAGVDDMSKPSYQQRPPDEMRESIWDQGWITPWQLFRIVAWKSAKGLAWLSLNDERQIIAATAAAVQTLAPWREVDVTGSGIDWRSWEAAARTAIGSKNARTGLLALDGVGYPVATAVLAFLAPAAFPVMDRWAVQGVFGKTVAKGTAWHRGAAYRAYAEELATCPALAGFGNVHQRDQHVMQRMMDNYPIDGLVPVAMP